MFLRDGKQAEVLLSQQDNFLSKEEVPVCINILFHCLNILQTYRTTSKTSMSNNDFRVVPLKRYIGEQQVLLNLSVPWDWKYFYPPPTFQN